MIKKIAIVVLTGSVFLFFYSCYNRKEELLYPNSCNGAVVTWSVDVAPIIKEKCAGCHRAGSTIGPGPLTNYTEVKNAAAAVKTAVITGSMPKRSTLTAAQIKSISCWVDSGAPND